MRGISMSPKVICIANQKSGVGKTTTAVSLAHDLARKGKRVLLIDLDPQGQCATALGHRPEPGAFHLLTLGASPQETSFLQSWVRPSGRNGLWILAGDLQTMAARTVLNAQDQPLATIRNSIQRFFKQNLDYLICDTAPSLGCIEERAVWASDLVIVPTATDFQSADGLAQSLHMLSELQAQKGWRGNLLGILPTFYDETRRECQAVMEDLQQRYAASLLPPIHHSSFLMDCACRGRTIFEFDPLCRAAKEYLALTRRVLKF
jgi:chromosome partitioning protein